MKTFIFKRESNSFDDILKDNSLKKAIRTKIKWRNHLIIEIEDNNQQLESYINLKFGDSIIDMLSKDYSPIMGVDYAPKKLNKFSD